MKAVNNRHAAAASALAALLAFAHPLAPAVILVENDCTLVDAISAANNDDDSGGPDR